VYLVSVVFKVKNNSLHLQLHTLKLSYVHSVVWVIKVIKVGGNILCMRKPSNQ